MVAVPASAVVHASFGDSVFVVEDKKDEVGHAGRRARRQAGQESPGSSSCGSANRGAISSPSPME